MRIPVANVCIDQDEVKAVCKVLKSGWLSMGPAVEEFEDKFRKTVGARNAIAVNNGTAALHLALIALGIKQGDEVIIPSLTFISTANVVLYQKAKPVLAECDPRTYNITPEEIEKRITKKTRAIIPVDMNGMPFDYDAVLSVAKKHSISVIADSAESLGALYKDRKVGSIAPIHCFSFFPNKNITTGEGGMVTTEDDRLAKRMRVIRNQGQKSRYNHIELGYNYRMTELQAAFGTAQLKKLRTLLEEKQRIADRYTQLLKQCNLVRTPFVPGYVTRHAWYMYAISVQARLRDKIVGMLSEKGIETRLSFPPVHVQPYYRKLFGYKEGSLPITYGAWRSLIDIPIWPGLSGIKQKYIINNLIRIVERLKK